jgi:dTDP-4-dehydrorhamnose 3,5-epimerase
MFRDERGWFMETFNAARFEKHGLPIEYPQDNHSFSQQNVLRGLHYQLENPQGKLVRCATGRILDVAVDIRRSSPTFGKWISVELSAALGNMLWIPPGFAHGFSVLSESADVLYKCTALWHQASDRTLLWNDPDLAINWGLESPLVSEKDQRGASFREAELFA